MGYKSVKMGNRTIQVNEDLLNEESNPFWRYEGNVDIIEQLFLNTNKYPAEKEHVTFTWDLLGEDPKETKARRIKNIKI